MVDAGKLIKRIQEMRDEGYLSDAILRESVKQLKAGDVDYNFVGVYLFNPDEQILIPLQTAKYRVFGSDRLRSLARSWVPTYHLENLPLPVVVAPPDQVTGRAEEAQALFAGNAAHAMVPLDRSPTAAFGLTLAVAGHAVGWPIPRGGSQRIADALASVLRERGGVMLRRVASGRSRCLRSRTRRGPGSPPCAPTGCRTRSPGASRG